MSFGDSLLSRRDIVRIAQRFNAGRRAFKKALKSHRDGRERQCGASLPVVPLGLVGIGGANPALKRWAMVVCPCGTNGCFGFPNAEPIPFLSHARPRVAAALVFGSKNISTCSQLENRAKLSGLFMNGSDAFKPLAPTAARRGALLPTAAALLAGLLWLGLGAGEAWAAPTFTVTLDRNVVPVGE